MRYLLEKSELSFFGLILPYWLMSSVWDVYAVLFRQNGRRKKNRDLLWWRTTNKQLIVFFKIFTDDILHLGKRANNIGLPRKRLLSLL